MKLNVFKINGGDYIVAHNAASAVTFYEKDSEPVEIMQRLILEVDMIWSSPREFTKEYLSASYIHPNVSTAPRKEGTLALSEGIILEYQTLKNVLKHEKVNVVPCFLASVE